MSVGDFIKSVARSRGTSAAKIERELGFSNGYIGTVRDSHFPYDRLVRIAEHLGVSPEYLWSHGDSVANTSSEPALSDDESALLMSFRRLDKFDRCNVAGYINGLLASEKYIKTSAASSETA